MTWVFGARSRQQLLGVHPDLVLACLGGTVAGYVVDWGVGTLVGWAVAP